MAELALLEDPETIAAFADALERGHLNLSSTVASLQNRLRLPHARQRQYRQTLRAAPDVPTLIIALRASAATAAKAIGSQPLIEVAWTYPGQTRPGIRTTGGAARDIVEASCASLLIVGYSVTVDDSLAGLAARTICAIASAAQRGVLVTAVLHRQVNRQALLSAWRPGTQPPSFFTWPVSDDPMAAMHAKLLIADRRDLMITSANLTYHGFERNLEMGVRIIGQTAADVHDRIHELIRVRELVPWND